MLTGRQIRAGLAIAGKNVTWLAEQTGISESTIRRAMLIDAVPPMRADSMARVQTALEAAGCVFLTSDAHAGEGVRWHAGSSPGAPEAP